MVNMAYPVSFQNFWEIQHDAIFSAHDVQYLTRLCVLFCDTPFRKTIRN